MQEIVPVSTLAPCTPSEFHTEVGRAYANKRISSLAHVYVFDYLEDLVSGADPETPPELRFKAAQEILNRYLGKPRETLDINQVSRIMVDV